MMPLDLQKLSKMKLGELDSLFRESPSGSLPDGDASGEVIIPPIDGPRDEVAEKLVHVLAWQGKIFDREKGELVNKVSPLGLKVVRAKVLKGESWLDHQEAIIIDYSKTSVIAQRVRDEIREIDHGLYLGLVFWNKTRVLHFALQFSV
jgi:hypothetical protein